MSERAATTGPVLSTGDLAGMVPALARLDADVDDAERVDQIRLLEELQSAAAAAQAKVTAAFAASQRAKQALAGVPVDRIGAGIANQVALAKRESPARARSYVGWASIVTRELPHTLAALQLGDTTPWRAMIVARETGWLSREHRAEVDAELGPRLEQLGDRQVEAEAKRLAYRLDPHGFLARLAHAENDRTVTLRPAPDTMTYLTGLLTVSNGVATMKALTQEAAARKAAGDPRTKGQIMADTLVLRVTGQAGATPVADPASWDSQPDPSPATVPVAGVEVQLLMTDQTLFNAGDGADEPAVIEGHVIPAELARRLVGDAAETGRAFIRRLYADPTGRLVGMDSKRRAFDDTLAKLLVVRDQICRTPWCSAPIRHIDHVVPAEQGGATSADNGQGFCEACNYAKQAPGWTARPGPDGAGHDVTTTTPTGHSYDSRPPPLPGAA